MLDPFKKIKILLVAYEKRSLKDYYQNGVQNSSTLLVDYLIIPETCVKHDMAVEGAAAKNAIYS